MEIQLWSSYETNRTVKNPAELEFQHPFHHQKRHRASVCTHPSCRESLTHGRGQDRSVFSPFHHWMPPEQQVSGCGFLSSILSTLRGEREKEEMLVIEERGTTQIMRKPSLTHSARPQQLSLVFWSTSSVFHSCSLISAPSPEKEGKKPHKTQQHPRLYNCNVLSTFVIIMRLSDSGHGWNV